MAMGEETKAMWQATAETSSNYSLHSPGVTHRCKKN